eukprot:scaffold139801_cov386-Phaeocystis_antarctica.AAC.1
MFDAACAGISLPGINQLYEATPFVQDGDSNQNDPDAVSVAMAAIADTVYAAASRAGAPKHQHH